MAKRKSSTCQPTTTSSSRRTSSRLAQKNDPNYQAPLYQPLATQPTHNSTTTNNKNKNNKNKNKNTQLTEQMDTPNQHQVPLADHSRGDQEQPNQLSESNNQPESNNNHQITDSENKKDLHNFTEIGIPPMDMNSNPAATETPMETNQEITPQNIETREKHPENYHQSNSNGQADHHQPDIPDTRPDHNHVQVANNGQENTALVNQQDTSINNQTDVNQDNDNNNQQSDRVAFSPSPSPIPQRRPKRAPPRSPSPTPPAPATPSHKRVPFSPESSASPIPVRSSRPRKAPPSKLEEEQEQEQEKNQECIGRNRSSDSASRETSRPLQSPSKRARQTSGLSDHSTPLSPRPQDPKKENDNPSPHINQPNPPQNKPVPPRPRPIRAHRPIKKIPPPAAANRNPNDDDEGDFFNLSSRQPRHFVSKTLGLTKHSPAPSKPSTSKSPTRSSLDPPAQKLNLVDLSGDENSNDDGDDSDDMSEDDCKNKKRLSSRPLPTWTRASQILAAESLSAEENEGSNQADDQAKRSRDGTDQKPRNGAKRAEKSPAKSRSPTPPPAPDEQVIRKTMKALYQTLTQQGHASSLQKQAAEAARKVEEAQLIQTLNGLDDPTIPDTYTTVNARGLNAHRGPNRAPANHALGTPITFTINMVMDPRFAATATLQTKEHYERPIHFIMQSGEQFDVVYQRFHEITGLPADQLVVSYDHIKLSPFVTPESVRIYGGNTALKVYESSAWEYVSDLRRHRAQKPRQADEEEVLREELKNLPIGSERGRSEATEVPMEGADGGAEPQESVVGLINLTVRTKDKQKVELSVKPSTSIRSILKNSLIHLNFQGPSPDPTRFKISFDGEDLPFSSIVSDHDLDHDDVLDLTVL
ncbi:hypothetical protein PGTUg99_037334 [Puccinia graminis f. sp. tritici]|uniref:Rad60/SUMO-like domain-containing protein n=1 Tax=Puccinia graminis f. sp. tritici TaxID=56615 RepID=A0A5B0RQI7_PUCGR|nr:hypothetical protein PGTUg99_037334 [Puccinia graminis f. sp. tritici]